MLVLIATGQPVAVPYVDPQGGQYPPNLEQIWSADELAAIGLKSAPNPASTPTCQVWQLKAVLTAAQTTAVEAAIAAAPNASALQAFWATGGAPVPADSTTLLALGAAIGLTAAQVAALVQGAAQVSIP